MFWTTLAVLAALTCSQVLAGVVKPEVFSDGAITEVLDANNRISMGWEAYPGQFPYVASLRTVGTWGSVTRCVGSVVHRNWILTSARCLFGRTSVVVSAGVTDLTAAPEYISNDTQWWTHPSYIHSTDPISNPVNNQQPNNIAIVKLQQPLVYNKLVQPIRVQPSAEAFANYDKEVLVASGWGRLRQNGDFADVLNWVYLLGITNAECGRTYGHVTTRIICATAYNNTLEGICDGDDGGPLVQTGPEGEPLLVGVTAFWSAAHLGCNAGHPSGFIRPGAFHDWLTEVTGLDFENLNEEDDITETPEPEPTTEATEPPTTEETEPTTTEATEPPTTEATEPPTTEETEPTTTEATEPPTTEATEPPTTEATEPTTTEVPRPPTTEAPESDSEESDQNSNDSDSSESTEDSDVSQFAKKLQLKMVKISKNKVNKNRDSHININS